MTDSRPQDVRRTRAKRAVPTPISRPRPLHEAVVDRLRDMIIEGEIAVGERLHEINLAETLRVSRTPVREALKLLASEGLVDLLPGRGARVSGLSPDEVEALFEVISGLERLAAELAAVRMSTREFERLKRLHDKMAAHFQAGERHEYFSLNHEIHMGIVAASKNETLIATHAALMVKARRGRYTALASPERWREAMGEHEAQMESHADGRDDERPSPAVCDAGARQRAGRAGDSGSGREVARGPEAPTSHAPTANAHAVNWHFQCGRCRTGTLEVRAIERV